MSNVGRLLPKLISRLRYGVDGGKVAPTSALTRARVRQRLQIHSRDVEWSTFGWETGQLHQLIDLGSARIQCEWGLRGGERVEPDAHGAVGSLCRQSS